MEAAPGGRLSTAQDNMFDWEWGCERDTEEGLAWAGREDRAESCEKARCVCDE
jgi:hypothetical protein